MMARSGNMQTAPIAPVNVIGRAVLLARASALAAQVTPGVRRRLRTV